MLTHLYSLQDIERNPDSGTVLPICCESVDEPNEITLTLKTEYGSKGAARPIHVCPVFRDKLFTAGNVLQRSIG